MARTKKQSTEAAVREIRRKTRRKFAPEEKVRIVFEGLHKALLVDCLDSLKSKRLELEIERNKRVLRELRLEIEREREKARRRASEQRKHLEISIEEAGDGSP
jgi:hypothetical protein